MSNAPAERPWPAPSPDTGWWRGEPVGPSAPPPPPAVPPDPADFSVLAAAPDETPTVVASKALVPVASADAFPLWPAIEAPDAGPDNRADAGLVVEKVHRGRHTEQARIEQWPPPELKLGRPPSARPAAKTVKKARQLRHPRRPAGGLAALLLLALLAGFFAWTSAEPLWLAAGRGEAGTAIITRCQGQGVLRRCVATFTSPAFTVDRVTVLGATRAEKVVGVEVSARMVARTGRIAYVGGADGLHARWGVGLGLLLLCGAAIAWLTGALRLPGRRARLTAILLSFAAPLLLFAGLLVATAP